MLIDIHCHLTGTEYDSVEAVLARAKENGVELITEEHMKAINDKRAKEKEQKKKK